MMSTLRSLTFLNLAFVAFVSSCAQGPAPKKTPATAIEIDKNAAVAPEVVVPQLTLSPRSCTPYPIADNPNGESFRKIIASVNAAPDGVTFPIAKRDSLVGYAWRAALLAQGNTNNEGALMEIPIALRQDAQGTEWRSKKKHFGRHLALQQNDLGKGYRAAIMKAFRSEDGNPQPLITRKDHMGWSFRIALHSDYGGEVIDPETKMPLSISSSAAGDAWREKNEIFGIPLSIRSGPEGSAFRDKIALTASSPAPNTPPIEELPDMLGFAWRTAVGAQDGGGVKGGTPSVPLALRNTAEGTAWRTKHSQFFDDCPWF